MARKELKGIDVSSWQGKINWREVKQFGIDFAILRVTEKNGLDEQFKRNAKRCEVRDIPYGVYKFSYALSINDAIREAKEVVEVLKGRKLSYPVFYDLEWKEQRNLGPQTVEAITVAFLNVIKRAGYDVGIYCNMDWYNNVLTSTLKTYPLWIASYPAVDGGVIVERLRPPVGMGWQYSSKGTVPGINGKVDMDIFYVDEKESKPVEKPETKVENKTEVKATGGTTAKDVLDVMRSWLGLSRSAQTHRVIIDTYNSYKPLARGYAVSYYDDYCDTTVSAVFIKLGAVDLIGGTECGVENHVKIFQAKGIWQEDGSVTPQPGWIIVYNWDFNGSTSVGNDGYSDHIGFVESVSNGKITTIEGNTSGGIVGRNTIPVGYKYIRGYAIPRYNTVEKQETPDFTSGAKTYDDIAKNSGTSLHKDAQCVGKATKTTSVREWAGIKYDVIPSYPSLNKGDLVDICDAVDGWYYVKIAGKYYGFVDAEHIRIV